MERPALEALALEVRAARRRHAWGPLLAPAATARQDLVQAAAVVADRRRRLRLEAVHRGPLEELGRGQARVLRQDQALLVPNRAAAVLGMARVARHLRIALARWGEW